MRRQLGITRINLDVHELDLDLDNFTNARFYRVRRTIKVISFAEKEYHVLELDDEELGCPGSNVLIVAAILQGKWCLRHVVWDDSVWLVVDDTIIRMLSRLAGLNMENLKNTAEWLRNASQRQRSDESDKSLAPRGSETNN